MERPPSYEAAIKQPNAFGGRIGVSLIYSTNIIKFHTSASQDSEFCSQANLGVPISVRNLVRQVTVQLGGEDRGVDETIVQDTNFWPKITLVVVILLIWFIIALIIIGKES